MDEPRNCVEEALEEYRGLMQAGAFSHHEFRSMLDAARFEQDWILARAREIRKDPGHECSLCVELSDAP